MHVAADLHCELSSVVGMPRATKALSRGWSPNTFALAVGDLKAVSANISPPIPREITPHPRGPT